MYFTANPAADAERYYSEQEEQHKEFAPVCERCGEVITSELYTEIDGACYCERCIDEMTHSVDDYVFKKARGLV